MFNIKKHVKNGSKSSEAASFFRRSRLRLKVKILMRLWWLRSRIKIFTRIFEAAPQHLFFLNRSILNIRFGAGAASLYGSGCS
jgi:hypothetical protein